MIGALRRIERVLSTLVLQGTPSFRPGDDVVLLDEDLRRYLGAETGTVEDVHCLWYGWEYRFVPDDANVPEWRINPRSDANAEWVTSGQIERYADTEPEVSD